MSTAGPLGRFWERHVLPPLIDRVMRAPVLAAERARVVGEAEGDVLEIGIGAGANLGFYRREVTSLAGIDPSLELLRRAHAKTSWMSFPTRLLQERAERLPFPDAKFDAVVSTWTLCSVADPRAALAEIRRVLRPGGRFLFIEHGLAEREAAARWQHRLTPCWRRIAGGCHLDRDWPALIGGTGFARVELERGPLIPGPAFLAWHVRGHAVA